ncbi:MULTISPECIES: mannitol dehydrogenase family protein [unclassified Luteococcus]|uniref:mannitol dehydrogenase family protein n=1 Tax=unclassified Luteococcus TaxID=2639923 RepID=UPI00313E9DEE
MTSLNHTTFPRSHQIGASAPQQTGIVHFGLGNFHRAHLAVNTAHALAAQPGDWGIVGIANRSHKVTDALRRQDFLYSIVTLDPAHRGVGVVDVHRHTLVAAEDALEILDTVADPAHRIISLTISESGYHLDPRTNELQAEDPEIARDLADGGASPSAPLSQLCFGLLRRFRQSKAPVTVLSCDNLLAAGRTTQTAVTQFLTHAGASEEFFAWLAESVSFPNAMVDRIVPAPTEATREAALAELGVSDEAAVPAELFTMWVIEDDFAAGRPRWEAAPGVIFSDEVEKYELVKLRLLNGGHSLLAYLGGLAEQPTIPEARAVPFVERCVRAALTDEYLPSIDLPTGFDADSYIEQLFARWSNSDLGDRTARVGSDGSTKLLQRVPLPAIRMLEQGEIPQQLALTVAGWICCVCPPAGFEPGAIARDMADPKAQALATVTAGVRDVPTHVEAILRGGFFPDQLTGYQEFVDRVTELVQTIVTDGVGAAADSACGC